jgi:hypothetical protein
VQRSSALISFIGIRDDTCCGAGSASSRAGGSSRRAPLLDRYRAASLPRTLNATGSPAEVAAHAWRPAALLTVDAATVGGAPTLRRVVYPYTKLF